MATVKGILGQEAPSGGVVTTLYTVPAGKNATVKVVFANRANVAETVRLAVSPNGASLVDEHYLAYDFVLAGKDAVTSVTYTLGDGDVVRVRSASGNVSFTCTGIEQDD